MALLAQLMARAGPAAATEDAGVAQVVEEAEAEAPALQELMAQHQGQV
jgi:hypothetical protein